MTDKEAKVRELVRTIADTAPAPPTALDITQRIASPELTYDESRTFAPVRRRAIVAAAAVVVIVAIVVALIAGRDQSASHVATRPALLADTWRALPPAPIVERQSYIAVAAGGEVLFWGGLANDESRRRLDDGAAYDPVKNSWRILPKSPLAPREGSLSVWSGAEWYVLGGSDGTNRFVDAAAFNPATNNWRQIADLPFPVSSVATRAAWTGAGIVLWDGRTAIYDPASNAWRLGASSPQPAVFFGDAIVLGAEFFTVAKAELTFTVQAYNWMTDMWRTVTPPPWSGPFGNSVVAIAGGELFIGGGGQGENQQRAAYRYDPRTDRWQRLPDAPVGFGGDEIYPDASPGRFAIGFAADGAVVMFDTVTDRWIVGAPDPIPQRRETPVLWTGLELIAWAGGQLHEVQPGAFDVIPAHGGAAYTPATFSSSDTGVCRAARHPWQVGPRFEGETGDGLPPSGTATLAAAQALLATSAQRLKDQYHALSAEVREEDGRAWRRAADGSVDIVDEKIFTIVLTIASPDDCPEAPVGGTSPLTFEVKN